MAIIVTTSMPKYILHAIKTGIDNNEIRTWSYDADGDYTHDSPQWQRKAWLRPYIEKGFLVFGIIPPRGRFVDIPTYSVYMGRFIEAILTHVSSIYIRKMQVTPGPHSLYDTMSDNEE